MTRLLEKGFGGRRAGNNHAQVVQALGRAIVEGRFLPGTLLPGDDELELTYGVSRTVLREAMKTLAAKGLLIARARIGTKVTPRRNWNLFDADVLTWHMDSGIGSGFLNQLFEMRLSIEPHAARLASLHAGPEDLARLQGHVEAMREAPDDRAFALADLEFHTAILEASGNVFMYSVGAVIEAALLSSFRLSSPAADPGVQAEVADAHGRIVAALAARDADAAAAAMGAVIDFGRDRLSQVIAAQE